MVIGYKKELMPKILCGSKIHTIREDLNGRWKVGNIMHQSTGVRTPLQTCYRVDVCKSIQWIVFHEVKEVVPGVWSMVVTIDDRVLSSREIDRLAKHDGFDKKRDFAEFFKDKTGRALKLLHWTDYKY